MEYVSDVLKQLIKNKTAVGISCIVNHEGKEIYRGCFGYADKDKQTPFEYSTICRIYSMTKIVTATVAMKLYERGLFRLEDPVKMYLPAFKNTKIVEDIGGGIIKEVPARKNIKMRHLLSMMVGIPYYNIQDPKSSYVTGKLLEITKEMYKDQNAGNPWKLQQLAEAFSNVPMQYEPGEGWTYGVSADILGAALEVISGKPLGQLYKEEIFEPLGLKDTHFIVPEEKRSRLAVVYDHSGGEIKEYVNRWLPIEYTPGLFSGGAGLYSTIEDYSRFLQMLANGGTLDGARILGRKTIENMTQNHVPFDILKASKAHYFANNDYGYGYLVSVKTDNTITRCYESIGSYWWGGVAGTIARVDPVEHLTTTIFMQHHSADQDSYVGHIMQAVYAML